MITVTDPSERAGDEITITLGVRLPAEKQRCAWASGNDPLIIDYHDHEWGVPVHDDHKLFEFLVLEGAQAGLSWSTVLKKRDGYRRAFAEFDPEKVARFSEARVQKLLADAGIIRNRLKIMSAVRNARAFLDVQGPQTARIQLRRLDRDVRVHASGRYGERSPRYLFPFSRGSTPLMA